MGTFSIRHWLVVLIIVLLIFGTKKLRNIGGDLGGAVKGFKQSLKDDDNNVPPKSSEGDKPKKIKKNSPRVIDAQVTSKKKHKS